MNGGISNRVDTPGPGRKLVHCEFMRSVLKQASDELTAHGKNCYSLLVKDSSNHFSDKRFDKDSAVANLLICTLLTV